MQLLILSVFDLLTSTLTLDLTLLMEGNLHCCKIKLTDFFKSISKYTTSNIFHLLSQYV